MSGSGSLEFRGYKHIGLHVVRLVITADCNNWKRIAQDRYLMQEALY